MKYILLMPVFLLFSHPCSAADSMDQLTMERVVKEIASESKGGRGAVDFIYNNVQMYLISDVKYNRMRIIAPIIAYDKLEREQIDAVLESNFHGSLDARYAVSKGMLFSAFIHPISELSKAQIKSAVVQVSNLALSFGSQYTSGILSYSGKQ